MACGVQHGPAAQFIGLSSTGPRSGRAESASLRCATAGRLDASELTGGSAHGGRSGEPMEKVIMRSTADFAVSGSGGHSAPAGNKDLPTLPHADGQVVIPAQSEASGKAMTA